MSEEYTTIQFSPGYTMPPPIELSINGHYIQLNYLEQISFFEWIRQTIARERFEATNNPQSHWFDENLHDWERILFQVQYEQTIPTQ